MFVKTSNDGNKGLVHKLHLRNIIGGLVMALTFSYMVYMLAHSWGQLTYYEWRIDYLQFAWSFICYSCSLTCAVTSWILIMKRLTKVIEVRKHIKYYIYTNVLRRLPVPLFYLFGRIYLYEQEGIIGSVMIIASLLELILIVMSGIIVCGLILPFMPFSQAWHNLWFPVVVLVVGALLLHPRTIRAFIYLLGQRDLQLSLRYGDLLVWLIIYSWVWVGGGLMLYTAINSLYSLPLTCLPAIIWAWIISGLVTTLFLLTSAGLGLKELTLSFLLSKVIPFPLAIAAALLIRVCLMLFEIVWGLFALKL
jgi:hypothetical protein